MEDIFVEAIVSLAPGADPDSVRLWMERRGFQVAKMRVGFLVSGVRSAFEKNFGGRYPRLEDPARGEINFPVPHELSDAVSSIVARPVPSYPAGKT